MHAWSAGTGFSDAVSSSQSFSTCVHWADDMQIWHKAKTPNKTEYVSLVHCTSASDCLWLELPAFQFQVTLWKQVCPSDIYYCFVKPDIQNAYWGNYTHESRTYILLTDLQLDFLLQIGMNSTTRASRKVMKSAALEHCFSHSAFYERQMEADSILQPSYVLWDNHDSNSRRGWRMNAVYWKQTI